MQRPLRFALVLSLSWPSLAFAQAGVRLTTERAEVRPDDSGPVRLSITADPPADELVLSASTGRVQELSRTSPTTWEAKWSRPQQTFPELVMIAAVARRGADSELGLLPLKLWGRGSANVKVRPGSNVVMKIGDRSYGPVAADARGEARVPFEAAPGEELAQVGSRRIDLKLPPLIGALLALDRAEVLSPEVEVRVRLVTFDVTGAPTDRRFQLLPSSGEVSAPRAVAPGRFEATWRPGAGSPGTERLECRLERAVISRSLTRAPLPAIALEVRAEPARVTAGAATEVELVIHARNAAGEAVEIEPAVAVELGTVSALTRGDAAAARARWSLPADLKGRDVLAVKVEARERGALLSAGASIQVSRPAARLEVQLPESVVGGELAQPFEVRLLDAFGHAVTGVEPTVESELTAVAAPRHTGRGAFEVDYRPPVVRARATDVVAVRAGSLVERRTLTLVPKPGRFALGARAGLFTNGGPATTWHVAADAGAFISPGGHRLGAVASVGYFQLGAVSAQAGARSTSRWLWLNASLVYERPLWGPLSMHAGLGGGAAAMDAVTVLDAQPALTDARVVPAAHALAALDWWLWSGVATLEVRGAWFADPQLLNFSGALWGLVVSLGYRFDLG